MLHFDDYKIPIILCVILLIFCIGTDLIQTKIEQNTFNKFSKTKATFVEAMFTNLRVMPD